MGKNNSKNPLIEEQFKKLKISSQTYMSGEIYRTKDKKVLFPTRSHIEDKPRLVVILGSKDQLNDPMLPTVLCAPITTDTEETTQCLPVEAGVGNLHNKSIIKAGLIQPILKTDLEKKIGEMDPESHENLKAIVYMNLGFGDDDESDNKEESDQNAAKD